MAVVGRVALFLVACAVMVAVAAPFGTKLPGQWPEVVIGTIAALGALLLTALFIRWEKLRMEDVGAAPDARSALRIAIGFAGGLFLVAVWALIEVAVGQMRWVRATGVDVSSGAIALMGYLALSCREELAFHGYPLRRLQSRFGVWPAQLMVAAAFAIEHRVGGWFWADALLGAGVGSLLFGMAAIASGGLALPIGLHAAWNFGQWALGMRGPYGIWKPSVPERNHLVGTMIYVAVFGAATIAIALWHRRSVRSAIFP
jgi:membrane protease YdiL (CAAX protease family)